MSYVNDSGSKSAPVWVVAGAPFKDDHVKGYAFSSPMGWVFRKMLEEAGVNDYYITTHAPNLAHPDAFANVVDLVNEYKPPVVIPLGDMLKFFAPGEEEISKYAGSLMKSSRLSYDHWLIPTYPPIDVVKQWKMREEVIWCDLAKAGAEATYFKANGKIQEAEERRAKIHFESFDELIYILDSWRSALYLSNDIETVYPNAKSQFWRIHPGYPITIGLAPNPNEGISFNLFRDSQSETSHLWKTLARLIKEVPSIGQNFFNFDSNFYQALGFELDLKRCQDTMIRHAVLWPEKPHKLQFLARQYTREKYWKDEGAGWTIKHMDKMKVYNCKDVMVTYSVFLAQEEEFEARPHLR